MNTQLGEDHVLKRGLERWRKMRLQAIEEPMIELTEEFRAAQDGLAIAHGNPGEVAKDVIAYLWDKLTNSASCLAQLERLHQELLEMDLPRLIVTFQRSKRKKHGLGSRYNGAFRPFKRRENGRTPPAWG